jgi:hypothetical protein
VKIARSSVCTGSPQPIDAYFQYNGGSQGTNGHTWFEC